MTLIELLIAVVVIGILAVVGAVNYTRTVEEARDREAESYLQALRQAALAYRETWSAYPTTLAQVPQVFVSPATETSSHWTYTFGQTTDPRQWTTPTATAKVGGRQIAMQENGTTIVQ